MRALVAAAVVGIACGSRPCEPREVQVTGSFEADLPGMYAVCGIGWCWTGGCTAQSRAVERRVVTSPELASMKAAEWLSSRA
jgi:hypothetical protein